MPERQGATSECFPSYFFTLVRNMNEKKLPYKVKLQQGFSCLLIPQFAVMLSCCYRLPGVCCTINCCFNVNNNKRYFHPQSQYWYQQQLQFWGFRNYDLGTTSRTCLISKCMIRIVHPKVEIRVLSTVLGPCQWKVEVIFWLLLLLIWICLKTFDASVYL